MNKQKKKLTLSISFLCFLLMFFASISLVFPSPSKASEFSTAYSTETNSITIGTIENSVIPIAFSGETDILNTTNSTYGKTYYDGINQCLNLSENSVKSYFDAVSCRRLSVNTKVILNNNSSIVSSYSRAQFLKYSSTNTSGYFEKELIQVTQSSNLGLNYDISQQGISNRLSYTTSVANVYVGSGSDYDNDLSDGIISEGYAETLANNNSNYLLVDHLDELLRRQILIKEILSSASTYFGTRDLDNNNDGNIDSIVFLLQTDPLSRSVGWSDLLWPHMSSSFTLPTSLKTTAISAITSRYPFFYTSSNLNCLFSDITINNSDFAEYNLMDYSRLFQSDYYKSETYGKVPSTSTLCHEMLHTLGFPDLYCYSNICESADEPNISYFDVMCSNAYVVAQYPNSYARYLAGWIDESNVVRVGSTGEISLTSVSAHELNNNALSSSEPIIAIIENKKYPNQIFVAEYRGLEGAFDGGSYTTSSGNSYKNLTNSGVIVYRIDSGVSGVPGYVGDLINGNYGGSPYGVYFFKETGKSSILLNTYNTDFGSLSSSVTSSNKALTYQVYDSTKNQKELLISDVTFANSCVVVNNVSENKTEHKSSLCVDWNGIELSNPTISSDKKSLTLSSNYSISGIADQTGIAVIVGGTTKTVSCSASGYSLKITLSSGTFSGEISIDVNSKTLYDANGNFMEKSYSSTFTSGNAYSVELKDNFSEATGKKSYVDPGFNFNNCSITDFVVATSGEIDTNVLGTQTITFTLTNISDSNVITLTRTVYVKDKTAPEIIINGSSVVRILKGATYSDLGASATDDFTSSVSVVSSGTVNTNTVGTYYITYTATDSAGNISTKTRAINVVSEITKAVEFVTQDLSINSNQSTFIVARNSISDSSVFEFYVDDVFKESNTSGVYEFSETVAGKHKVTVKIGENYDTIYVTIKENNNYDLIVWLGIAGVIAIVLFVGVGSIINSKRRYG